MKRISRDDYYTQNNNPTEMILKVYGDSVWLVSCGPTTMINCIAPLGYDVDFISPSGKFALQPEECVMDFFHDPRNANKLDAIRSLPDSIAENEVPQYYPYAASMLFGATAKFEFWKGFDRISEFVAGRNGGTVQICLENPGHYLAVIDYDSSKKCLIYNDSWPGRHEDGNGFHRYMDKDEYNENVKNYVIWYFPRSI
jgi:hypothetical protein